MTTIAVINHSTVLKDADVRAALPALQQQISKDFAPVWGHDAVLVFGSNGGPSEAAFWQLVLLDDSDQAGALGYHDLTPQGLPLSKVFAKTDAKYGLSWTVTASHELLEMLADPFINLTSLVQSHAHSGLLYALEVCDAVESDTLAYKIADVLVSDFVYPSWFVPGEPGPYDLAGHVVAPLQLLSAGYISVLRLTSHQGWQQKFAEHHANPVAEGLMRGEYLASGSRRERRARGFSFWQLSVEQEHVSPSPSRSRR